MSVSPWCWDTRQPSPAMQVQLPERCYALSCVYPLLVVGTAERHIQVYNLSSNPQAGAYTRPLCGSTLAISVGQGVHLGVIKGSLGGVKGY
jgi:hypothetical protein